MNKVMKAIEAPEKIYVNITHPISNEYTEIIAFEDGDGVEYTRTDAFIKKACEWFRRIDYDNTSFETIEEFIVGFKNYMKRK